MTENSTGLSVSTPAATRADDAPGLQKLLTKALLAFAVALATRAGKRAAVSMVPTTPRRPGEPYLH